MSLVRAAQALEQPARPAQAPALRGLEPVLGLALAQESAPAQVQPGAWLAVLAVRRVA